MSDERCANCGHTKRVHTWNGKTVGRCWYEACTGTDAEKGGIFRCVQFIAPLAPRTQEE